MNNISESELERMNEYIEDTYAALQDAEFVSYKRINKFSSLYRIEGSLSTKNPFLISAHLDVVPAGDLGSFQIGRPYPRGVRGIMEERM